MAEILSTISTVSYVLAVLGFALAIYFWFKYNIPEVYGDLSGKTAQKSIARMREHNEKTGNKTYRSSPINVSRGKLTGTMPESEKLKKPKEKIVSKVNQSVDERPETGLLSANKADLVESEATGLLVEEEGTALLNEEKAPIIVQRNGKKLTMVEDSMFIHTDEVIS